MGLVRCATRPGNKPEAMALHQSHNKKGPPEDDPFVNAQPKAYSFTLSFSAFAMVILTTLSASFLNCSPVAGLRTIPSGRSRQ